MGIFQSENLDRSLIKELVIDINEHYQISEHALIDLDRDADNPELVNALFRSVHTIKGDLDIVGFRPIAPLMNTTESILGLLRQGSIAYSPMISDLILLVLDLVRGYVNRYSEQGYLEYDVQWVSSLCNKMDAIACCENEDDRQHLIAIAIQALDPSVIITDHQEADQSRIKEDAFLEEFGFDLQDDVQFFRDLMEPIESRSQYWHGRGDRILKMAMIINHLGGSPVDDDQLAVAVYAHDFGMAFIPLELLHKEGTLTDSEILLLRSHVQSSAHLLQYMEKWSVAKEIVLQHHEMANGSGYPYGLREKEMCEGAKILAIADTFDALTHQRAYTTHQRRPIIRAVKEINECAGKQLSAQWVDIFNQAVEPVIQAHRSNQG